MLNLKQGEQEKLLPLRYYPEERCLRQQKVSMRLHYYISLPLEGKVELHKTMQ